MSVTQPDQLVQFFGTIQNGKVVSAEPIDLPDGTAVQISTTVKKQATEDDGWDNSPEGIAAWLKWMDSLKPVSQSPTEETDTDEWLKKMDECGKAKMEQEAEDIFK